MQDDPVLAAYGVGDNCFEIGGAFSPASVRDQMVRAYLVVDRLLDAGLISAKRSLLVVGAGSTGITAAVHAARRHVPTTLIDKKDESDFLLSSCATRDVEPTLYDWPTDHWQAGKFPCDPAGAQMPFPWVAGKASEIAVTWDQDFQAYRTALDGKLRVEFGTSVDFKAHPPYRTRARKVRVPLSVGGRAYKRSFGAVVACGGWGEEKCEVEGSTFRSYWFWESDPFEEPNWDLPAGSGRRILISGGGDGALQDFIRVMTGKGAGEVFRTLREDVTFLGFLGEIEPTLASAEDVAGRALQWTATKRQETVVYERLERAYEEALDSFRVGDPDAWKTILDLVSELLIKVPAEIRLAHTRAVFLQCYPLNRFLGLMILRVLGGAVRMPKTRVDGVRSADGHTCSRNPETCHGLPHSVQYKKDGVRGQSVFDIVILRHGLNGPRSSFDTEHMRERQILPYFVDRSPQ